MFFTDYQDFTTTLLYYSPELIIALSGYVNLFYVNSQIFITPISVFDNFNDVLNTNLSEFVEYFFLFFLFI